ncbi:MAG: DMT family transporter [Anaerolineales bacterium]|nr:DMT family transporter [Anaerolineales bacterium]
MSDLSSPAHLSRGYLTGLTCALVFSSTGIFIRHLTQTYGLPALVLAFWRDLFVVLSLILVLGLVRPGLLRVAPCQLPFLALFGLVLAVYNSLWTLAVALTGAAVATVLVYSSAAFTALLGRWLLKEHLDAVKLLVVTASLGGCLLVSGALDPAAWQGNLLGIFTGIFSGLAYAAYSLLGRSAAGRGLNPWTTLTWTFGCAALFLLGFNLLGSGFLPGAASLPADLFWLGEALAGWGVLFLLAAGPTLLGYGLYNVTLGYLPSGVANLIVTTEPAITAVIAYFVLGEILTGVQLVGGALILGGVAVLRLHEGRLARETEPGSGTAVEAPAS